MIRDDLAEGLPLEVVHHEVPGTAVVDLADVPDLHDVRVLERARRAALVDEPLDEHLVLGEIRVEQLDGVARLQQPMLGEEHLPHAALAQELEQPVRTDVRPDHRSTSFTASASRPSRPSRSLTQRMFPKVSADR
jgi:hypothetical protein